MKKIVITGGNRGIGLGLTKVFLSQGHIVIATTKDLRKTIKLLELKKNYGDNLQILTLDVTNEKSILNFSKNISSQSIDILVNNAGIMEKNTENFADLDISTINKTLEVNTLGPMKITQLLINKLLKADEGKVFFITSKMGSIAENSGGGCYSYRMSKTALNMFCRSFSIDYPKIISIALHPGWVKTDMGGSNAITTIEESAIGLAKIMLKAKRKSSGGFFDFEENELPW